MGWRVRFFLIPQIYKTAGILELSHGGDKLIPRGSKFFGVYSSSKLKTCQYPADGRVLPLLEGWCALCLVKCRRWTWMVSWVPITAGGKAQLLLRYQHSRFCCAIQDKLAKLVLERAQGRPYSNVRSHVLQACYSAIGQRRGHYRDIAKMMLKCPI